ncbi:MAG: sorbosone dehydrogenase [Lentisphaerae bacterium GWF2_57_35]|nr:MAG: sorbosone dehydrogenase [Lentisphaerae bacterium GWF2_57_35]
MATTYSGRAQTNFAFAADHGGLILPKGFQAVVVADRLGSARHLTVRDNGDVYVALRRPEGGGGIVALRDTNGDGQAEVEERFGELGGTGIRIHDGYLYLAQVEGVIRYRLRPDALMPELPPETVVSGFPRQRQHADKPIAFDEAGGLYVNVGAPSNNCQERDRTSGSPGKDPCPELERQAGIWRFSADALNQTQTEHGEHYATGIRQAVAMCWNPAAGALYVVQHGRDQLDLWPQLYDEEENAELPAEEFLLVEPSDNFGWPYGYYDQLKGKRVLAPEYGGDGEKAGRTAQYKNPILAFPGHWAPNDLLFYRGSQFPEKYRGGAFIAFHGSWNRAPLPQKGFKVVFVPFKGRLPSGKAEVFADGFAGRDVVAQVDDARFRPMGLAEGPDGSLYISDSKQGRIWRIMAGGQPQK